MDVLKIGSAKDEIQYRMARLREAIPGLAQKKIVIYGTGINAKRVLDCMDSMNILGLMDCNCTGKYIYGKKVLAEDEILLLKIDTIIIAAEPQPTEIIYMRISAFCMKNHITILDMYGCNEFQLHQNILRQELEYLRLDEKKMKSIIFQNKGLIIFFENILCSKIIHDEQMLYEKVEYVLDQEGMSIPNFKRKRILAQERISYGADRSLRGVYNVLSTIASINEKQMQYAKDIEEKLILENLIPRFKMIELLKYAIDKGLDVYVCSDMLEVGQVQVIDAFMQQYGITQYKKIVAEDDMLVGLVCRTVRALEELYGNDKVLFIGEGKEGNLVIPQLYQVNYQLIKSSYDMFLSTTGLQISQEVIKGLPNRDEIISNILQVYDSPYVTEIDQILIDSMIAEKIEWHEDAEPMKVDILQVTDQDFMDDNLNIIFPKSEMPLVSIIIPAYNRFEYTYYCLKSILLNTDSISYEVIVADDGSSDMTSKIEEIIYNITVIHNEKPVLFPQNCNKAAQEAKGKYLVFLNNDTQVQLNWLNSMVKCIVTNENAGLVGSKLVYSDGRLQSAGGIIWNNGVTWQYGNGKTPNLPDYNYVREVDYVAEMAFMITKELWKEIGGFDKRYVGESFVDVDLAFEVRKRGKRVLFQPDSVVVHFGETSHGKEKDNARYQKNNWDVFFTKWKWELSEKQYFEGKNILAACERKQKQKTILFVSEHVPTYDKDAGSRTLYFYIQEFIRRGYIVKFIPANLIREEPYTHRLEQMGVEVFEGKFYQKAMTGWIYHNHKEIDFAFLNYPYASLKYIDILKKLGIPVMYYGVDLHYLRLQREYELFKDESKAKEAREFYEKEAYLIKNSDAVYYPSLIETKIVEETFHQNNVKQLVINIYDTYGISNNYQPENREGIMFIGGYRHAPNVDAVLWFSYQIFPTIYKKLKIPFYIVGVDMPPNIRSIDVEGTEKIGALTDTELEEMYRRVKMIVVPLRYGAGIKGKIVEAMYHGIPIVTTSIGMEGIPNEDDAVKIADDQDSFAKAVISLYQSDSKLTQMSKAGQQIIIQHYSRDAAWNKIAEDFS